MLTMLEVWIAAKLDAAITSMTPSIDSPFPRFFRSSSMTQVR